MKRRKFTRDFKISVLSEFNSGKTIAQISAEKGISPGLISKWRKEYKQDPERAFAGEGKISSLEAELNECKKVIGELYLQVDFLKKVQTNLQKSVTQQRLKKEEDFTK
jgi:transposase